MNYKNFAYSTVAAAPSPATSGLTMDLAAGGGAKMPSVPFQGTVWPSGVQPLDTNAEIVTVTGVVTDTLTMVRASEYPSSARTIVVGDQFAATLTKSSVGGALQPRVKTLNAGGQLISTGGASLIFDTDVFDVGDMHDVVTNNEKIIIVEDGLYFVHFKGFLTTQPNPSSGSYIKLEVQINLFPVSDRLWEVVADEVATPRWQTSAPELSEYFQLSVADEVVIVLQHNDSADQGFSGGAGEQATFTVVKVSD